MIDSKTYEERARKFQGEVDRLAARSRLISNLRGLSFGLGLLAGILALAGKEPGVLLIASATLLLAFAVFVVIHARVIDELDLAERWVDVNHDAENRLQHRWEALLDDARGLCPPEHPYAFDLDLFGSGSVYQRLSVARTVFGRERLAELLLKGAPLEEVQRRQAAVRALAADLELRQRFEAHALGVVGARRARDAAPRTRSAPNPAPLLAWAESEPKLSRDPLSVWGARLSPPVTLLALALALGFGVRSASFVAGAGLLLQAVLVVRSLQESQRAFDAVSATEGAFLRYGVLLELIERSTSDDPLLKELRDRLNTGAGAPSQAMSRFRRIVGWFDLRHNALIHPFVNWALLWDLHCTLALERWQLYAGKKLRIWFEVIGWFEALSSLASFAADEPNVTEPELVEGEPLFEVSGLAHPLLDPARRVANDVTLRGSPSALLVTGSNMSGKSTLMRAMGVAAVLALAGAPVTARRMRLSPLTVRTSIQVADSLEQGVSHFLAELKKLKGVIDAARTSGPVLFLLDEILHGTNSRERQMGARWVLSELLKHGALGAISTHDEELCRLPPELMEKVSLVHLRESVQGSTMTFDYHLYPGPVTTGNALRLMRLIGLDVPLA